MIRINKKRGILLLVILAAAAAEAIFLNTLFGYLPVFMLALAIGISRLYLGRLRRALEFTEESAFKNCIRGERMDFTVHVKNRSRLFVPRAEAFFYTTDLFGGVSALAEDAITLAGREERTFSFDIRFDHVGVFSAGLHRIVIRDLFGLFSCTCENENRYEVTVLPRIYDIGRLPISEDVQTRNERSRITVTLDGSDYTGVREYVPGDPIKTIHWKLSARTQGYMTKQFETNTSVGLCTILDFYMPAYDEEGRMSVYDTVLEAGITVHNHACKNGYDAYMRFYDRNGTARRLIGHRRGQMAEHIRKMPKAYSEHTGGRGVDLLLEEGRSFYSLGNIAICTADLSEELLKTLLMLRTRHKNPLLFAVIPPGTDRLTREQTARRLRMLDGAGIYYELITDAEQICGGGVLTEAAAK